MSPAIIIAVVVFGLLGGLWAIYNSLIAARNKTDEAWSDINVQLKRRYDLIPNLMESVKGYATHEAKVFDDVTNARSQALAATGPGQKAVAENMLAGALKSLFAVAEAYPDLKANQNFLQLQNELVQTEDTIQASRRFYNANVRDFNIKLQVFPTNLIAKMLGFSHRDFFDTAAEQAQIEKPVEVKF